MHLASSLLSGLTGYYALDQFEGSPAQSANGGTPGAGAEAGGAGVALEPWLSSRFEELPASARAPRWHVASDEEASVTAPGGIEPLSGHHACSPLQQPMPWQLSGCCTWRLQSIR